MLSMVEKYIRGGIWHSSIMRYVNDHDGSKESSYIQYWDVNNLNGWPVSKKLPVNNRVDKRYFSI